MFSYSRLFRSRWMALMWSIGILWSAYSFVGSDSSDDEVSVGNDATDTAADLNEIQMLVGKLKS